ncbi:MAG TPA: HEAT repeat domain-containing protein, partial [Gemmataceae bacterium]
KIADRVARLIAQLDDDRFRVREAATKELKQIGSPAEKALRRALTESESAEVRRRAADILRVIATRYEGHSAGWHWIYGSIAHGQTFRATGRTMETLRLRVARLNSSRPAAPLEVEIRDPTMRTVYARGLIETTEAEREFAWRKVRWRHRAALTPEQNYVLFFHSQDTSNKAPWVVNAIYKNLYPDGTHLGYPTEDFFFHLTFTVGRSIQVGPGEKSDLSVPISSGSSGGTKVVGPLALVGFGQLPPGEDTPADSRAPKTEKK